MPIPDLIRPGLRLVFCGTALSTASERRRAYYAGPGNKFWPTLHAVGLTPRQLAPEQYPELLSYGFGLTDLCKSRFGSDREIGRGGYDPERLLGLIEAHAPARIAFTSKRAASEALGVERVAYGPLDELFSGAAAFVLPSPSGAANGYWDIGPWRLLAELVAEDHSAKRA